MNSVRPNQLQTALKNLSEAIRQTEATLETMPAEHDPLASHIFVSRRQYRNMPDTKSGREAKRRELTDNLHFRRLMI